MPHGAREADATLAKWCQAAIQNNNLDQLLVILNEMLARNISLSPVVLGHAIRLCCDLGLPRLALDLADKYESTSAVGYEVPSNSWSRILRSSAETYFVSRPAVSIGSLAHSQYLGVEKAWSRTAASRKFSFDEGLLVNVLNVAARSGKPEMVSNVLEVLARLEIDPQEHHLQALLEAYVNAGLVPQALQVLSTIRAAGLEPTAVTAQPILAVLDSTEVVDKAFWALEDLRSKGERVDVAAFNVVLAASAKLADLQRVRATQMSAPDLGVDLNVESFNHVLAACATNNNRQLSDTVMKEMSDAGIACNGATYHHMIVCSLSQPNYEDAFFFLEKSKSEGYKPLAEVYQRLANKCEAQRDSRARLVEEEAEALGYKIDRLRRADGQYRTSGRRSTRS